MNVLSVVNERQMVYHGGADELFIEISLKEKHAVKHFRSQTFLNNKLHLRGYTTKFFFSFTLNKTKILFFILLGGLV